MHVVVWQTAGGHEVDVAVFGPRATKEEAVALAVTLGEAREAVDKADLPEMKRDLTEVGWWSDHGSGDFWAISDLEPVGAA